MVWKRSSTVLQAASGAGQAAMDELEQQTRESLAGDPVTMNIFPFQVHSTSSTQLESSEFLPPVTEVTYEQITV